MNREPMRGEVWDVVFPAPIGRHPAVVLSINRMNSQIGSIAVLLITGTTGPSETHVSIESEAGVTKYDESFVNITDVHSVDKQRARKYRGRLDPPSELSRVERLVRTYLGL